MNQRDIASCIFFLFIFIVADGQEEARSNHFDVLIFTQRWPQTVCFLWKENSASHACSLPKGDEWTIHGIWPSEYHKLGPQFCNKSLPFNESALKPIEDELKEKWIDVEKGTEPYSFWRHEWDKHGTCAAVLEKLNSEVKYFQEGLALLNTYDMKYVLAKAGILPASKHTVGDILNAVERILGKRGEVMCVKNKKTGESYIFEIRICFDKELKLTDCDGVYQFPTDCDRSQTVMYPGDVPRFYHAIQV